MSPHRTYWQGTANSDLIIYNGSIQAGAGDDTLVAAAAEGPGQIHLYGQEGGDRLELSFLANINAPSSGHHAAGELKGESNRSANTFAFTNISNVVAGGIVVVRLQDFDASRHRIEIGSQTLDLHNLPSNVRIVSYNGNYNDPGAEPQQWLLIKTATGGYIFYALSGFRIDMNADGGSGEDQQEIHFVDARNLPDFDTLQDVEYVDPVNHVPAGFLPRTGGQIINDDDISISDVLKLISGTSGGDLIAAGLNDDTVSAYGGDDRVWGGDGDDRLNGQNGNDTLYGGNGTDVLRGAGGHDDLFGDRGNDTLLGDTGNDYLHGDGQNDSLSGGAGEDTLIGGTGNDRLRGGTEADIFVFSDFHGADRIYDFDAVGDDRLDLSGVAGMGNFSQVMANASRVGTDVIIETGAGSSIILEDVSLAELDAGDFIF